jgi:hypothetical protein
MCIIASEIEVGHMELLESRFFGETKAQSTDINRGFRSCPCYILFVFAQSFCCIWIIWIIWQLPTNSVGLTSIFFKRFSP